MLTAAIRAQASVVLTDDPSRSRAQILIANSRGPETLDELAAGIGPRVTPMSAFRPSQRVPG
jgi:hypothetical protein